MGSRNSHENKQTFRNITAGDSVITGGIDKEIQLLPVPVVPPSVFTQTMANGSKQCPPRKGYCSRTMHYVE